MLRHLLILPRARRWLSRTIAAHETVARPIAALRLPRLTRMLPEDLLASTRVVATKPVPKPPLHAWGFGDDDPFSNVDAAGITLRDMIFVLPGGERHESLLFHELIHAIQWRSLGVNRFLALYGLLMLEHGYFDNPLEAMAYDLQEQFDAGEELAVDTLASRATSQILGSFRRRSLLHRAVFTMLR